MSDQAVRAFLRERGVADHVVEGGFQGIVSRWEHTARDVEHGYELDIEDWLNDLDGRQLLEDAQPYVGEEGWHAFAPRVEAADARFRAATVVSDECLWGEENARQYSWTPEGNWWYWRTLTEQ